MSIIKSFPNNQDEYVGAEYLMKWFHGRTSGVWGAEGEAAVQAVSGTMSVTVTDGGGWLSNHEGDGIVWWIDEFKENGELLQLDLDIADGALNRIDRIVVSWETTNYVARPTVTVLKGTPAASPTPPALTNNTTMRQISLARVYVGAGVISINAGNITDERFDDSVCGIVTNTVPIDTSMIKAQIEYLIDHTEGQAISLIEAIEQELASVVGGTGFDPSPIRAHDLVITPASFVSFVGDEGTEEAALNEIGYIYKSFVPIEGVLSTMTPYVTLSLPSVEMASATIANQFKCDVGGVYVYSDSVPSADILALTVECRKAVTA